MTARTGPTITEQTEVRIEAGKVALEGRLGMPQSGKAIVVFAHGSGGSHHARRDRYVAERLNAANLVTLRVDLLTPKEQKFDEGTQRLRFDIGLLAERLSNAVNWVHGQARTERMTIGLFGASTGTAAALVTAADRPEDIDAIVSRSGRPDLAENALARVEAPTLLIVGGEDRRVAQLNETASSALKGESRVKVVPGAGRLFQEPAKIDQVARLARKWFVERLLPSS